MQLFIYQLKQAYLSLKQKPGFVFSVVSTMGITLGALLCVITLSYLLLVEPLPYPKHERIFIAEHKILGAEKETKTIAFSYAGLVDLYKSKVAFEQAAMLSYGQNVITSHINQPLVNTTHVTPELHEMLASPMEIGRMFNASEALDTTNPVAMLSYKTWQQHFNGNANILEQTIKLRGVSYRIVGVLAKNFVEPKLAEIGRETQVWLSWDFNPADSGQRQSFTSISGNLKFIGLLKEGISESQANQILTPLVSERWQKGVADMEFFNGWSVDMSVRSVKDVILGESESVVILLLAGVIGLVLIAYTNISNLFMARTAAKQRQLSIQAAIGASKKHLFKSMFVETSTLMFMSSILALMIAKFGFYTAQQYLGTVLPRVDELTLNPVAFGSAVLLTIVFALLFAKLSTRMINYRALNTTLQSSGKGSGLQVSKKTRQLLIASQIALATVLVFINFGLLTDAVTTIKAPIGFTTNNISTLVLNVSSLELPSPNEATQIMTEIIDKLEALPQVESISQGSSPLDGFSIKALTKHANNERYTPYFKAVDQQYFNTIEQPLIQGKNFTLADRRDRNHVMIVNQAFAKQLKVDGDVLGMRLSSIGEPDYKIIGIVKDISIPGETPFGSDDASAGVPRSYAANQLNEERFIIKVKAGKNVSRQQLGRLLAEVDSRYSVFSFNSASDILTQRLFSEITTAVTTVILACLVLLLAGIGLYGILSYGTQLRRFEVGTRMAIGATSKHIIAMIINDNSKPVLAGFVGSLVLFCFAYIGFGQYIQLLLTWQILPMVITTLILIISLALISCYWPLRQYINKPAIHSLRGSE